MLPIQAIESECEAQMREGVCLTLQPIGRPLKVAGIGDVPQRAWNEYVGLVNKETPRDPAMCRYALVKSIEHPGSDYEVTARMLWTPQFKREPAPTPAVDVSLMVAPALLMCAALAMMAWRRRGQVKRFTLAP